MKIINLKSVGDNAFFIVIMYLYYIIIYKMKKLNEVKIAHIISEELKKSDVIDMFKKDKDFEKQVKKITSDVLTDLFRVLWQHNGLFKNLAK
jgi:hypothetical protein